MDLISAHITNEHHRLEGEGHNLSQPSLPQALTALLAGEKKG